MTQPSWGRGSTRRWRTIRAGILQRDDYRCYICGADNADSVDHIIPITAGGTDNPGNLAAIHQHPCHRTKSQREAATARHNQHTNTLHPTETHPALR